MSPAASPFTKKNLRRGACHARWELARSSFTIKRAVAAQPGRVLQRRDQRPLGARGLLEKIREVINASPFYGEGHRKCGRGCALRELRKSKARCCG